MTERYFVTGTDTGVGKTYVTCQLLRNFQKKNKTAIGIKPVLSGTNDDSSDTALLMQHNSIQLPLEVITPCLLDLPTSPNIAAKHQGIQLSAQEIVNSCEPAFSQKADILFIEGIGGWDVPINDQETMADVAKQLNCPVILVVGLRLGCLNHALLTAEAIRSKGLVLHGWVANELDPHFIFKEEYVETLKSRLQAPLIEYFTNRS